MFNSSYIFFTLFSNNLISVSFVKVFDLLFESIADTNSDLSLERTGVASFLLEGEKLSVSLKADLLSYVSIFPYKAPPISSNLALKNLFIRSLSALLNSSSRLCILLSKSDTYSSSFFNESIYVFKSLDK